MQTRSSPSVSSLHSLAREAGMSSFTDTPKPILYRRLKENYNLNRLQRAHKRGLKRRVDEDMCDFDADLGASSSSSSSSYPDESSPRAMRHAGRSARHDNELEPWDERRGDPDDSRSRKRSRESSKGKGRAGERSRTPPRKAAAKSGYSKPRDAGTKLVDPIMLTELPPGALTFEFQRPNGTGVVYHLNSLIDYFLATGDFTEPETRIEFSDADLKRIDEIAAASQLGKSSVLAAKLNPTRFNDAKLDRDAIVGLERCAGELVADMLKVIESNDPEEGQMRLIMYLFPLFSDLHRQLRTADAEYSSRCMDHFAAYVNGPPNRPTVDKFGFLPIVLSFFRQLREGESMDFGF